MPPGTGEFCDPNGNVFATEDTETNEVRGRSPQEVIGNGVQERLIDGNHKDTKAQSFPWCLRGPNPRTLPFKRRHMLRPPSAFFGVA